MKKIPCFSDVIDAKRNYTLIDIGTRVIEVDKIIGTVDKCRDLDAKFRYIRKRNRKERYRRGKIFEKMQKGVYLDPIDVYQYQNAYYVLDGNRRTAAAKKLKAKYIDANIIRYADQENAKETAGIHKHQQFELETGVETIILNDERGFDTLLNLVKQYPKGETPREKALKWKSEIFLPALGAINDSELPQKYPEAEPGDIFVRIINFYQDFMGVVPDFVSFSTLISSFMFARRIKKGRIFRSFPLSLLAKFYLPGREAKEPAL